MRAVSGQGRHKFYVSVLHIDHPFRSCNHSRSCNAEVNLDSRGSSPYDQNRWLLKNRQYNEQRCIFVRQTSSLESLTAPELDKLKL